MIKFGALQADRSGVLHDQTLTGPTARAAHPILDWRDHQKLTGTTGHDGENLQLARGVLKPDPGVWRDGCSTSVGELDDHVAVSVVAQRRRQWARERGLLLW